MGVDQGRYPIFVKQEVITFESILQKFGTMACHHIDDDHAVSAVQ